MGEWVWDEGGCLPREERENVSPHPYKRRQLGEPERLTRVTMVSHVAEHKSKIMVAF